MKRIQKIAALLVCAALMLALSACHVTTPAVVVNINGTDIGAGLYLINQLTAHAEASSVMMQEQSDAGEEVDSTADVLSETVEGMPGEQWVYEETIRLLSRYVWLQENGVGDSALTAEEIASATAEAESGFEQSYTQEYYESNGIGKESYVQNYLAEVQYNKILTMYIDGEGANISTADAMAHMDELYSQVNTITFPAGYADGTSLSEEDAAALNELAESVKSDIASGKTVDEVAEDALKQASEICGIEYTEEILTQYVSTYYVTSGESYYFDSETVDNIMSIAIGETGMVEGLLSPMVYVKIPNYESEEDFVTQFEEAIIGIMATDAVDARIEEESAAYTVEADAAAVSAYSPKKIA